MADPTEMEEQCGPLKVVVGVALDGTIKAVQLVGPGTISPNTLKQALKVFSTSTRHLRVLYCLAVAFICLK